MSPARCACGRTERHLPTTACEIIWDDAGEHACGDDRQHLHLEDYPATLELLAELRRGRPVEDWALIGYEPTEHGAWVSWEDLAGSWLSTTEKAVIHIAHGCAILERAGGPPPRLRDPLRHTLDRVAPAPAR